jgi:rubrerythrin
MSISFSGRALINIAIDIEKSGIAFYDIMSTSTDSEEARAAFRNLAQMERDHVRIFQDMLGEEGRFQSASPYGPEYAAYVKSLVENAVFSEDMLNSELAEKVSSDIEAVELAIEAEKDSILFYYEIKEVMAGSERPAVEGIINEEKSHLRQLSLLKKELAARR